MSASRLITSPSIKKFINHRTVIVATCLVFFLAQAIVIQAVVGSPAFFMGYTESILEPFTFSLVLIAAAWVACIAGAITSGSYVKKGGAVVAKNMGALQATANSQFDYERALIKVVAKTAIAYGCSLPSVHVLREEDSINSFVVGSLLGDTALIITKGALRELDEDELSGMTAHEFAHIANNDVPRNMRLMVAFSGLLALDQYGRILISKYAKSAGLHPIKALGFGLIGLGFVGVLFANVLRRIYTRRTEIRADKTAAEILQRTKPLSSALAKVKHSAGSDSALHTPYVDEVRHLCFHAGNGRLWRTKFNSSHPSIDARLRHIDPKTVALYSRKPSSASLNETAPFGGSHSSSTAAFKSPYVANAANDAARTLGLMNDEPQFGPVSDKISMTVQDPVSCLAALFALFLPADSDAHPGFLSAVAFAYNQHFSDTVVHVHGVLKREIETERYSFANHAVSQLKIKLSPEQSRRVLLNLERLLKAQGLHNLMNYSTVQFLRHELNADFPVLTQTANINEPNAQEGLVKPWDKSGEEFSRLISQVLAETDLDSTSMDAEHARVMATYPDSDFTRCDDEELAQVAQTEAAFQLLLMQPRAIRETFVQHCNVLFSLNSENLQQKNAQLDLLCASLGCSGKHNEHWKDAELLRQTA